MQAKRAEMHSHFEKQFSLVAQKMQTQREQLIAFHWGIKLSFSNSLDLLASLKIFSEQTQLTVL